MKRIEGTRNRRCRTTIGDNIDQCFWWKHPWLLLPLLLLLLLLLQILLATLSSDCALLFPLLWNPCLERLVLLVGPVTRS